MQRHSVRYALENDLLGQAAVGLGNLSDACFQGTGNGEALEALAEALALTRRSGDRRSELFVLSEMTYAMTMTGSWEDALTAYDELPEEQLRTAGALASSLCGVLEIFLHRGQRGSAQELLSYFAYLQEEIVLQDRAIHAAARAALLHAEGRLGEALEAGAEAASASAVPQAVKQGLVWAVESALALGEPKQADDLLTKVEQLPPGLRSPFLEAQAQRFRARMSGEEAGFKAACGGFREYSLPFWLAVTQLEHAEWLTTQNRSDEAQPLLSEARQTFEQLQATPWLERAARTTSTRREPEVAIS